MHYVKCFFFAYDCFIDYFLLRTYREPKFVFYTMQVGAVHFLNLLNVLIITLLCVQIYLVQLK